MLHLVILPHRCTTAFNKFYIVASYRCTTTSCVANNGIFYEFKVKEK